MYKILRLLLLSVSLNFLQAEVCPSHKPSPVVNLNEEQQKRFYIEAVLACSRRITTESSPQTGRHCNMSFDGVMCWPYTKAGSIAVQDCPEFIHGFNTQAKAYRYCTTDGEWYFDEELNMTVADYHSCIQPPDPSLIQKHIPVIQTVYKVGYSISLFSLIVAVVLMLAFKKLHCQRNTIHINLFFSFILRSIVCLIKDTDTVPSGDVISVNGTISHIADSTNWKCKLLFTLFQYLLTCNYMWIFMEGLYLYILIFFVIFQKKKLLKLFIIIGWSCPLLSVIPWVIVRIHYEDSLCWNTHDQDNNYYWIIKAPIFTSIVVNFFFFINIIRVLFTKLSATNTRDPRRYKKLVKSTLVLIPLFGVYYVVFIGIPDCLEEKYQVIRIYSEMILNSFQGVLVAILFCFLNGEVRSEIQKKWNLQLLRRRSIMSTRISSVGSSMFALKDRSPSGVINELCQMKLHENDVKGCNDFDKHMNGFGNNNKFKSKTVKYIKMKRTQSEPKLKRNESGLSTCVNFTDDFSLQSALHSPSDVD